MMRTENKIILMAIIGLLLIPAWAFAKGPSTGGQKILGKAPVKYGAGKKVRKTHNEDAIVTKIWVPDLDEKFVPQGLTWAAPYVLVAGYIWDGVDSDASKAVECRVYRIDPKTGKIAGQFTMGNIIGGSHCNHAGGLAFDGGNTLYVSDTHYVFKVDVEKAFTLGSAFNNEALLAVVKLGAEGNDGIVGSFAAWAKSKTSMNAIVSGKTSVSASKKDSKSGDSKTFANPFGASGVQVSDSDEADRPDGTLVYTAPTIEKNSTQANPGMLWLGRYTAGEEREKNTRIHAIPSSLIAWADEKQNVRTLTAQNASDSLWLSAGSQGAAFDKNGDLWVSRTVTRWLEKTSVLHKKDPKTGDIIAKYNILHGLEDLAFDDEGNLWAVSESGTWKYRNWKVFSGIKLVIDDFYPLLIKIDVNKLKSYD